MNQSSMAVPLNAKGTESRPTTEGRLGLTRLGEGMLSLGAAGLVATPVCALSGRVVDGSVPACALVLSMFGFALRFPTLLQDGSTTPDGVPNVSTMRVAVLMIVSAFTLVVAKLGWASPSLAELKIDSSWAWVLAAALGGKATQSFAETGAPKS